jgi:hypothetical protein
MRINLQRFSSTHQSRLDLQLLHLQTHTFLFFVVVIVQVLQTQIFVVVAFLFSILLLLLLLLGGIFVVGDNVGGYNGFGIGRDAMLSRRPPLPPHRPLPLQKLKIKLKTVLTKYFYFVNK